MYNYYNYYNYLIAIMASQSIFKMTQCCQSLNYLNEHIEQTDNMITVTCSTYMDKD